MGDTLRLNRLDCAPPASAGAPDEVSPYELFECDGVGRGSPNLHAVLATSYGCDYGFVDSLVDGSPADLAGNVIIFDNQRDHHRKMGGLDQDTYARRTVVMPHFHSYASTQAERMRMQRGTMHPKLMILEFRSVEGAPCERFLRVVIGSANLGQYDSRVNNQYWVHDFPSRMFKAEPPLSAPTDAGSRCAACDETINETECYECAALIRCSCERHLEWGEAFCASCALRSTFHNDLCRFLIHLFGPTREERPDLFLRWRASLSSFDLTPPAGVHLILSVPGRFSEGEHSGWGQWALAHKLRQGVAESMEHPPVAAIEYALSSCGRVEDFRQEMWRTLRTGAAAAAPVRVIWPTIAMATTALDLQRRSAKAGGKPSPLVDGTTNGKDWDDMESATLGPALTIDGRTSIMYGPSDQVCRELRGDLAEHTPAFEHRRGALHHIKIAAGLAPETSSGHVDGLPLCSWLYLGSHNLSGAAWGKSEEVLVETDSADSASPATRREYVVLSYELGVLIIPHAPRRFPLPWVSPAKTYGELGNEGVLPFSTARYLSLLHGRGEQSSHLPTLANAGKARLTIAQAAQDEVADAEGGIRRLWERNVRWNATDGAELPRLFTIPHGEVRRLLYVRVNGAGAQSYLSMPRPPAARARMRHIREMELVAHRQGGSNLGQVMRNGSEHIVLQLDDFTVGNGEMRQRGDAMLKAFKLASGVKTYFMSRDGVGVDVLHSFDSEVGSPCVLLVFLRLDRHGLPASNEMLSALASAQEHIDRLFWGVVPYDASELPSEATQPCEHFMVRHSVIVAHQCGLRCEDDLPALVAIGTRSGRQMLRISGEAALAAVVSAEGGLTARLQRLYKGAMLSEWTRPSIQLFPNRMADVAERQHCQALRASLWVRSRGFTLLLIEPEGVLKTPLSTKIVPSATAASNQRRKGRLCLEKNDSFVSECVAFFRALMLDLPPALGLNGTLTDGSGSALRIDVGADIQAHSLSDIAVVPAVDTYNAFSCDGSGPTRGRLRPDAPKLALVSNVGELEVHPRPGQSVPSLAHGEAAVLLHRTVQRLASELGVDADELGVKTYIAPQGRDMQAHTDLHGAWEKPGPGMLIQGLRDARVDPTQALMIGFDYTDEQAAFAAGVGYIDCMALFSGEDLDDIYLSPDRLRASATAPRVFAAPTSAKPRPTTRDFTVERTTCVGKRQRGC